MSPMFKAKMESIAKKSAASDNGKKGHSLGTKGEPSKNRVRFIV